MSVRIVALSDTHNFHSQIEVPKGGAGSLLCHLGDWSNFGRKEENKDFLDWFEFQRQSKGFAAALLVVGNHDKSRMSLGKDPELNRLDSYRSSYPNIKFLIHDELEVLGLRVFGCSSMNGYGPSILEGSPEKVDLLLTHAPPYGMLDETQTPIGGVDPPVMFIEHIGDKPIATYVRESKPRFHLFGHCHFQGGQRIEIDGTTYLNCACHLEYPAVGLARGVTVLEI